MARCIVGALLEIGQGRIPAKEMAGWIDNPEIGACRHIAPAKGLFLMEVYY
jgi:tRNA U38,U39,U40 pseudouridine synthase TruA